MNNSSTTPRAAEPEHIAISKSRGIKIDWAGGHHSDYPLALLRDNCPCATCTGAHGAAPQPSSYSIGAGSSAPFPMFKPALRMTQVEETGRYAIRIVWSDGHSTGIYSFDHLRAICPCADCLAAASKG